MPCPIILCSEHFRIVGGFLTRNDCQKSVNKISRTYAYLGTNYTHDKLLSELSFAFWKFMFAGRQFQAGGSTLLAIFPNLPVRRNQGFIYHKLDRINSIRNRVAHHEPICFGVGNIIGTVYARGHFLEIRNGLKDVLTGSLNRTERKHPPSVHFYFR